jgi:hypothetical protein
LKHWELCPFSQNFLWIQELSPRNSSWSSLSSSPYPHPIILSTLPVAQAAIPWWFFFNITQNFPLSWAPNPLLEKQHQRRKHHEFLILKFNLSVEVPCPFKSEHPKCGSEFVLAWSWKENHFPTLLRKESFLAIC